MQSTEELCWFFFTSTCSISCKKSKWNISFIMHTWRINASVHAAVCELSALHLLSQFCSSPHEAARCCQTRALETEETLITRSAAAERRAGIALHRIASVPSAHTAPHRGSYPYSGAARITRNTVRKIHSRGFSVTALQVKLLSINLCFTTETYSQCMCSTLKFFWDM